jgi:enoyl-CoA hydratase
MTSSDDVKVDTHDGVMRVTIDRPQRMNALNAGLLGLLEATFTTGVADPGVRVVVITGAGTKAFCTGADLGNAEDMNGPDATELMELSNRVIAAIIACPKPVIAAVNGAAAGFGVSLALAADLAVATSSAYFLLSFSKVGLMPDGGTSALVAASIGRARAMKMAMLAPRVYAADAAEMGLIAEAVDDDGFAARITELQNGLVAGPPLALRKTKDAINDATLEGLPAAFDRETVGQVALLGTNDFLNAAKAFTLKQTPVFSGT